MGQKDIYNKALDRIETYLQADNQRQYEKERKMPIEHRVPHQNLRLNAEMLAKRGYSQPQLSQSLVRYANQKGHNLSYGETVTIARRAYQQQKTRESLSKARQSVRQGDFKSAASHYKAAKHNLSQSRPQNQIQQQKPAVTRSQLSQQRQNEQIRQSGDFVSGYDKYLKSKQEAQKMGIEAYRKSKQREKPNHARAAKKKPQSSSTPNRKRGQSR